MVKKRTKSGKIKIVKQNKLKTAFSKFKFKKKAAAVLACSLILSLLLAGDPYRFMKNRADKNGAKAAEEEQDALSSLPGVKFSSLREDILPEGMILIGAYLVYDQYLTDPIYNLAVESMTRYNQSVMYYKSTMASGDWLDLSSAVGLTDLRGRTGDYVKTSELGDYKVCAIVDENGNMYAVNNDGSVGGNIFDIQNPYDIMALPDLTPVSLLYSGIASDIEIDWDMDISDTIEDTGAGRVDQLYEKIWTARLLDTPLDGDKAGQAAMSVMGKKGNDTTDRLDKSILDLNNVYTYYKNQGNVQYMNTIVEAMGQADAERRAEVYYMLAFNGAGKIYDYIQNRQYDMLISKEDWAERFMTTNWGSNWRYDDIWSEAIDKCIKDYSNDDDWSSVDIEGVADNIADYYLDIYCSKDNKNYNVSGVHAINRGYVKATMKMYLENVSGSVGQGNLTVKGVFLPSDDVHSGPVGGFAKTWVEFYTNIMKAMAAVGMVPKDFTDMCLIRNKLDEKDETRYTMVYVTRTYAWALSQAGDRLADVKYWADRGDYQKAFENYMSLMQRTGTTMESGVDFTSDGYVVAGSGRLNALLQRLETGADLSEDLKKTYSTDAEYTSAIKESIESCEQSYYKYANRLVQSDKTYLGKTRYETMQYLINNAGLQSAGNVSADYTQMVMNYTALNNISKDIIAEKQNELNMLNDTLIPQVERSYIAGISALPSALYNDAVANGQSEEVQRGYLDSQKAELDGLLTELEFMVSARIKRIPIADRIPYVDSLLVTADGYKNYVKESAFSTKANDSIQEYIDWLNDLKKKLLNGSTGNLELDALESQKAAFEDAYMDALDSGDMDAADEYKKSLDDLNAKIKEIKDSAMDSFLNGDVAGASDAANMLGGTPAELIDEIKKKAAGDIEDGDFGNIETYLMALGDLGATDAIEYIERLLGDAGASTSLMNAARDAKESAAGSAFNAEYNGSGGNGNGGNGNGTGDNGGGNGTGGNGTGGNGTGGNGNGGDGNGGNGNGKNDDNGPGSDVDTDGFGDKNDKKYDSYNNVIYDIFGDDFDNLNDGDKASSLIAISKYGYENGDLTAQQFAMLLLKQLLEEGNPFVYQKYMDNDRLEYINMAAIDRCRVYTNYRYVYKDGLYTMSQTEGSASYNFAVSSMVVLKSDGSRADLTDKVVSQTDLTIDKYQLRLYAYLVKEDSEHYLDVSCYYIPDVIYAVLIPQVVDEKVEELLGALGAEFE